MFSSGRIRAIAALSAACAFVVVVGAFGAGTVTVTERHHDSRGFQYDLKEVIFDWEADSAAVIDQATSYSYTGQLLLVRIWPDSAADNRPCDDYDLQLFDADSLDILFAGGADLDSSTTYLIEPGGKDYDGDGTVTPLGMLANSVLRLHIDNSDSVACAACAKGKVYVWIR